MRWLAGLMLAACANAGTDTGGDGSMQIDGTNMGSVRDCPAGQLATNVGVAGEVTCAAIDTPVKQAIDERCSIYAGWRDNCDGCTTAPAKWGAAGTTTCLTGVGANNTCTTQTLAGDPVRLLGLDFDGDVNGDDKIYGSLHCAPVAPTANVAPCPAGEFVSGMYGSSWTCSSLAETVVTYVRDNCTLYLGWQDGCDGCVNAPAKWGRAGDTQCMNGVGADNTCIPPTNLGGEMVNLFGLNTDGDVDGNDKLHAGLHCVTPTAAPMMAGTNCPAGYFLASTSAEGGIRCVSPAPTAAKYFTDHCSLYLGWRDNCDGCTTPPAKWGKTRVGTCTLGVGADDTCTKFTLGQPVDLFGLSPDGDVDGNDALFVGFRCN